METLPDGQEEITIDLTQEERKTIREHLGVKKLTNKRIKEWFLETLENTYNYEKETQDV